MDHEDTKEINESTRRTLKKWKTAVIVYGIFLFFFGPPIIIAVMAMPWSFNDLLNFFKMAYEDITTFPNSIIRYLIMCLLAFLFSLPRLIVIYLFIKALILNRKTAAKVIIYIVIVVIEISVIWCFYSYYLARARKPIIYLYPETRTEVNVKLDINGRLVTTYPAYDTEKGWKVTADPDGTLTDKKGRKYSPVISFPHRENHYLHSSTHYSTFCVCVCVCADTLIYLFFKLRLYEVFKFWKNKFLSLK